MLGVGLTRWNDLHPGFNRQNRPHPPAGAGFEADLGTARGRSYRVRGCASVSTARCTPLMGFLGIFINDTNPVSTGEGPRACAVTLCQAVVGRRHARARGARAYNFLFFKRGSVPPRCTLGSAILHEFSLRNGSNQRALRDARRLKRKGPRALFPQPSSIP